MTKKLTFFSFGVIFVKIVMARNESLQQVELKDDNNSAGLLDTSELDQFIPEVYAELKRLAAYHLKKERPNHTLRPTELVHEAYLLLQKQHSLNVQNRAYFISVASSMMWRVLINYAKRRNSKKREAGRETRISDEAEKLTLIEFEQNQVDIIALDESLKELAKRDARQVKIVEMHFVGGLTFEEVAEFLQISVRTVMREWRFARIWLYNNLNRNN